MQAWTRVFVWNIESNATFTDGTDAGPDVPGGFKLDSAPAYTPRINQNCKLRSIYHYIMFYISYVIIIDHGFTINKHLKKYSNGTYILTGNILRLILLTKQITSLTCSAVLLSFYQYQVLKNIYLDYSVV